MIGYHHIIGYDRAETSPPSIPNQWQLQALQPTKPVNVAIGVGVKDEMSIREELLQDAILAHPFSLLFYTCQSLFCVTFSPALPHDTVAACISYWGTQFIVEVSPKSSTSIQNYLLFFVGASGLCWGAPCANVATSAAGTKPPFPKYTLSQGISTGTLVAIAPIFPPKTSCSKLAEVASPVFLPTYLARETLAS